MIVISQIQASFSQAMAEFARTKPMRMLADGEISLDHYKAVLREMYHYAREDPQIQALATVFLRGEDRSCVKMFLKHAVAEVGHDIMALGDLKALGVDVSEISTTMPLPATVALTAYPFYQTQYHNPIGYLGYLYFLEHMPTVAGAGYMSALNRLGIPETSMTFLAEHVSVDVAHNKLMLEYIERLVKTPAPFSSSAYCSAVEAVRMVTPSLISARAPWTG